MATYEALSFTTILDLDIGFRPVVPHLEREVLDIRLDFSIVKLAADETLGVENARKNRSIKVVGIEILLTYVLWGFIATWFFAASPIRRSLSEKETYEGVVRFP